MGVLHTTTGRWKLGLALALGTAAIWSTLPIALKILLAKMGAGTVVWTRFIVSSLLLTAVLGLQGRLRSAAPKSVAAGLLLLAALLSFSGNNLVFLLGLNYITPTAAQVVIQLAPMMLLVGGVLLFREPFGRLQRAGAVLLAVGMLAFFNDRVGELLGNLTSYARGVLLVIAAAALWAAYALSQKQLLVGSGSLAVMWGVYTGGAALLWPLASISEWSALDDVETAVLAYCCLGSVIGYGAFAEALAHWDASRVGAVVAATPLFTAGWAMLGANLAPAYIEPESFNLLGLAGALAVSAGSALTALADSSR